MGARKGGAGQEAQNQELARLGAGGREEWGAEGQQTQGPVANKKGRKRGEMDAK